MAEFTITVLFEDTIEEQKKALGLEAIHGLAILINRKKPKTTILMDTGQSSNSLLHNMKMLDFNLDNLDVIFLSHGHYDHTGGLLEICNSIKENIPILAHPDVFNPKFKIEPHLKYIGCPFTQSNLNNPSRILLTKNSVPITKGIITSGEINRITGYEKPRGFWTVMNEKFIEDMFLDDQALILNISKKGLVILSGCAHSGIINTIKHAQKLTGLNSVYAVIGGYHLVSSNNETVRKTIKDLIEINPSFLYPCHCTGNKNILKLTKVFGRRCKQLKTGDVVKI